MTDGRMLGALAAIAIGLCGAPAAAAPLRFTLEVAPTSGTEVDQYEAVVHIELSGLAGPDRYVPPDFGEFEVVSSKINQGTASVIDPRRGQSLKTTIIRRYQLRPRALGNLRIRAARLRDGGQEFETRDAWVKVRGTRQSAADGGAADPTAAGGAGVPGFEKPDPRGAPMFIHAVADRTDPWVGQQVVVTWLLYTRSEVLKFEPKPPGQVGYASEVLYEPDAYFTYHEDTIGGVAYSVAVVSKRAVFPGKAGKLEIAPYEARVSTLETSIGRPTQVRSRPLVLDVKALPPGAPPGFDPTYVGRFSLAAAVDRAEIDAAEALTLELSIEGTGNIRGLGAPQLSLGGFAFRAPRDDQPTVRTDGDRVRGERVFRYWTTPEKGGAQEIPAIALPFFDPATGKYDVATSRPLPIMVKGDPSKLDVAPKSGRENLIARDIRLSRGGDALASRTTPILYKRGWFWLLAALPGFLFVLVVATDRIRQRMRQETPRARLRRARGKARQHFRVAEIHLKGNRPAKFFGELSRALYEHLEERIGQPIQSMTRDELRAFLKARGFDHVVIGSIDMELEQFDFARFAPSMAGPGEMRAAQRKVRDLLKRIEKTRLNEEVEG